MTDYALFVCTEAGCETKISLGGYEDKIGATEHCSSPVGGKNLEEMQEEVTETKEFVTEEQDKEDRRNNIIIHRVPESDATNEDDRTRDDRRFVSQLLSKMQVGVDEKDLKEVQRVGGRVISGNAGPSAAVPRALRIEFQSPTAKNAVMENLSKLQRFEAKFKNITVHHDMTLKEREEYKKMLQEAQSLTESDVSGDFVYRVRGSPRSMKIVQLRKYRTLETSPPQQNCNQSTNQPINVCVNHENSLACTIL